MSLSQLSLKCVYNSENDNLLEDFYIPVLSRSISFDRSVGFFSATMLSCAAQGLRGLLANNGKMRLIVGAIPNPGDELSIQKGYDEREQIASSISSLSDDIFFIENNELYNTRLDALQWLVAHQRIDIRVALRQRGLFHEKIGIASDANGNSVVFQGSANDSKHALDPNFNYESINVFCSWRQGDVDHLKPHLEMFKALWSGGLRNTLVIPFPEAAAAKLVLRTYSTDPTDQSIEIESWKRAVKISEEKQFGFRIPAGRSLRKHQSEALNAWKENEFSGILSMATGSGKTVTALYAACKLVEACRVDTLVISVPYVSLAEQWIENAREFGIIAIGAFGGENQWRGEIRSRLRRREIGNADPIAIVVVNRTLISEAFQNIISRLDGERLLFIADECHHHGSRMFSQSLPDRARYRIGLSATHERYGDREGTQSLIDYYGKVVYEYSLKDALQDKILCSYRYFPILCEFNEEEVAIYTDITKELTKILGHADLNESDLPPAAQRLLLKRRRILGSLESKYASLDRIIRQHGVQSHSLIFCGDGSTYIDDTAESADDFRDVDRATRVASELGAKVSRFTAYEPARQRQLILDRFRSGDIEILTAIRCLDEGIDIPDCRVGHILASSRNPRQFIQRRGRLLRRSPGKSEAIIFDYVAHIPNELAKGSEIERNLIAAELERVIEFAEASENYFEAREILTKVLRPLGLSFSL